MHLGSMECVCDPVCEWSLQACDVSRALGPQTAIRLDKLSPLLEAAQSREFQLLRTGHRSEVKGQRSSISAETLHRRSISICILLPNLILNIL